jgi:hypothetical protein
MLIVWRGFVDDDRDGILGLIALMFRTMRVNEEGLPVLGRAPSTLGVQIAGPSKDVNVLDDGTILPQTGGMSVFIDPRKMPKSLRPRSLATKPGESPFPILAVDDARLPSLITFRRDTPHHGLVEPRVQSKLEEYEDQLGSTRREWTIVYAAT